MIPWIDLAANCGPHLVVIPMSSKLTSPSIADGQFEDELKPGTKLLRGQYVIEKFLNNGGFGITYLAKDSLHRMVVIKECFPESICGRSNSTVRVRSRKQAETFRTIVDLFIEEARNLARLSHPNIVGVHQVFEDNDTAYMAMDFVEGRDLLEIVESSKSFNPAALERIVVKLLDAVEFIHHEGILHRDISPDNILLSKDNDPVLIDFGAARETVTCATRYLGAMRTVKDGYSPQEFYVTGSEEYPSSDLYSLAASLYHVMTKELPVSAQERLSAIAGGGKDPYISIKERVTGYSGPFLEALDLAHNVFPKNRIQSAAEWRALITQSRISQITRGSVSRPMLAVDNGNVLRQFEGSDPSSTQKGRSRPEVRVAPHKVRPTSAPGPASDDVFLREDTPASNKGSSGKGMYLGAVASALLVLIGSGAYFVSSGDKSATPSVSPSSGDQMPGDLTAETGEPSDGALTETRASDIAAQSPVTKTLPRAPMKLISPEQLPALLSKSSSSEATASSLATAYAPEIGTNSDTSTSIAPVQNIEAETSASLTENEITVIGSDQLESSPSTQLAAADPGSIAGTVPSVDLEEAQLLTSGATSNEIQDVSSVITAAVIDFPVKADIADPTIVTSIEGPAAEYLQAGHRILSINGYPIDSLNDFQRVVNATTDFAVGDDVRITLGIEDPATGRTFVQVLELPAVQEILLLNGVRFQTTKDGDAWTTIVINGTGQGQSDLQPGDRMVALMPTSEMIDTQGALPRMLRRELQGDSTQLNFAVNRGGDMWFVTMQLASGTGN